MLNCVVWNKTVFTFVCKQKTVYLCKPELFEIDVFDHLIVRKQMFNWIVCDTS